LRHIAAAVVNMAINSLFWHYDLRKGLLCFLLQ